MTKNELEEYRRMANSDGLSPSASNELLDYIDELESMPLVQTVVRLQAENEWLKKVRGADATHCHHRYLITEECPYCKGAKELAINRQLLQEENEKAYQMNSDMALTLIEKSDEIERLTTALEVANDCLFGNTHDDKVLEEAYQVISQALQKAGGVK